MVAAAFAATAALPTAGVSSRSSLSSRARISGARLPLAAVARPAQGSARAPLRINCGGDMQNQTGKLLGDDFGGRDPYPGEIGSNFGTKSLGEADTEHIKKVPEKIKSLLGLTSKKCVPCESGTEPLGETEINRLKQQTPGWQVVKDDKGVFSIKHEWEVKDFKSGLDLFARVAEIAEAEGHHPDLHLEGWNKIRVEISTHAIGGLSENDFIVAAKLNEVDMADLLKPKKQRFWA